LTYTHQTATFKQGHRIRLDISSSNFPRFDANPNTGDPLNDNRRWQVAENTIYLDGKHPSQIILPVICTNATTHLLDARSLARVAQH
jgi:predicted acyl esterase